MRTRFENVSILTLSIVLPLLALIAGSPVRASDVAAQQQAADPAACPAPLSEVVEIAEPAPIFAASCGFCQVSSFCPREQCRCDFTHCTTGPDKCCVYSCEYDASCTQVSQVSNACPITCPRPPCEPCQVGYCEGEGIRCTYSGTCGPNGCCNYTCGPDPSCTGPDQVPPNAC